MVIPIIKCDSHLAHGGGHGGAKIDTGGIRELSISYYVILHRILRLEGNPCTLKFSGYLLSVRKPGW